MTVRSIARKGFTLVELLVVKVLVHVVQVKQRFSLIE
jgi:Tfp pilus assembly protein FimT